MRRRRLAVLAMTVVVAAILGCGRTLPRHAVLTVEGMHCDSCSAAITAELQGLDGVSSASADWHAGRAEVTYDPSKLEEAELRQTVEGLGYKVTGIEVGDAGGARP